MQQHPASAENRDTPMGLAQLFEAIYRKPLHLVLTRL